MSLETIATESSLLSIMIRFFFNMIVLIILVRFIYYRFTKKAEYLFSFLMMGIVIFLLCSLLETVDIQLGMALGLFAIFAILRFRTVNYTTKDMTYIFTVIGVSVINSQANIPPPLAGALIVNSTIIIAAFLLELFMRKNGLATMTVVYNKPELLNPASRDELLKELSVLTGIQIVKVRILEVNVVKGMSELEAYYRENGS